MLVVSGRVPFKETANHHITHRLRKKKSRKNRIIDSNDLKRTDWGGDFVGFLGGYLDQLGSSNGELLVDAGIPRKVKHQPSPPAKLFFHEGWEQQIPGDMGCTMKQCMEF